MYQSKRHLRVRLIMLASVLLCASLVMAETLEEKVRAFELKNGMKFLVVERNEAPVTFCGIVFDVGAANEWPNVTGISHLLEHMMFKGTRMMGTTDYQKELPYIEKTDALGEKTIKWRKEMGEWRFDRFKKFSAEVMGSFSDEEKETIGADKYQQSRLLVEKIRQMESLPRTLVDMPYLLEDNGVNYLEMYLEYEAAWGEIYHLLDEQRQYMVKDELWEAYMNNGSRFLNAGTSNDFTIYFVYLPSNRLELWMTMESDRMDSPIFREFWSERDVVMEERRLSDNNPDRVLSEAFNSVAFTACPYKWPVLGWMSDLLTTDRKELAAYHKRYYAPNNAVAMIVGDVDADLVQKWAEEYFGPIPAQDPPPRVETREPEQKGERRVVVEHSANSKLMIGFHKPIYPDPDDLVFQVIQSVLSGGRTSRMYKSIYEEKELTAAAPRVYFGPGQRYDNLLVIEAEPRHPHTLEEVEAAVYEELEKLKTEPVTDRELQRIKNQLDAATIRQLGSNLGIAFQIGMGQVYYGDYKAMFRQAERLKKITAEDVQRVAGQYLVQNNRTVGYRVKVEKEEEKEEKKADDGMDRELLMKYIQSLGQEEQMAIFQQFQQFRNDPEGQKKFAQELMKQAREAGFDKKPAEKKEEKE